jgi:hypothetical protein
MSSSALGGNQHLLVYLGGRALMSVDGLRTYFLLQRRHPDGAHWVNLAHYRTRDDAEATLAAILEDGHGEPSEFRVRKVIEERT